MTQILAPRTSTVTVSPRVFVNRCTWHGDIVETMRPMDTGFKPYDQRPKEAPL